MDPYETREITVHVLSVTVYVCIPNILKEHSFFNFFLLESVENAADDKDKKSGESLFQLFIQLGCVR